MKPTFGINCSTVWQNILHKVLNCRHCRYAIDERVMSDACVDGSRRVRGSLKDKFHLDPATRTWSQESAVCRKFQMNCQEREGNAADIFRNQSRYLCLSLSVSLIHTHTIGTYRNTSRIRLHGFICVSDFTFFCKFFFFS